ncbi:MAG: hypothetical protein JY451_01705 [Erythrobacter sp.]|nr:MAG: hypothetical protein JY451_01705 [Erythrobacter sp.]
MDAATIRQVGIEFDRLDTSSECERLEEVRSTVATLEAASARAEERFEALSNAIRDGGKPKGAEIADALLAGSTATFAETTVEAMEAERASIRQGIVELRRRLDDADRERQAIERDAKHKAGIAAKPLIDDLSLQAGEAVQKLASIYAAMAAVNISTGAGAIERSAVGEIIKTSEWPHKIAQYHRDLEVPADVAAVLRRLDGKSEALKLRFVETVSMP